MKESQIIEVSELVVERLKDAIAIMDERGHRMVGDKSTALWNREWDELRSSIFDSMELLNNITGKE